MSPGSAEYVEYVDTNVQIPGPSASFDYQDADPDRVGWGVSGDYPDYGDAPIASSFFSPFSDVPYDITDTNGDEGTDSGFFIVDGSGAEYGGETVYNLGGTRFHCAIRDGEGVVAGSFCSGGSSPCNIKLYDFKSGNFTAYLSSVQVLRPIHAVVDRLNSVLYIVDAFRIYGSQASYGGAIVRISLADGTGYRMNSFGGQPVLYPRAVHVSGDKVYVCDTGNHRIIVADRTDPDSGSDYVSYPDMRFPYAFSVSKDGRLLVRAFHSEAFASSAFSFSSNGSFTGYSYDASSVGWDDLCGGYFKSGLYVADSGGESNNGIYAVGRSLWVEQERLYVDTYPVSIAAGWLRGDCMAILEDDTVSGFSPEGKAGGLVAIPGSSSGFVIPDHSGSSFTVIVPSSSKSMLYSLRNDIGSSMIRTMSVLKVPVRIDKAIHLLSSSALVASSGPVLKKYGADGVVVFSCTFDSDVLAIHEDPKNSIILVFTDGFVHAVDSYDGMMYASEEMLAAETFAYCIRKSRIYAYGGGVLSRYTVFANRTSKTSVSFAVGLAAQVLIDGVSSLAVQEREDRLFVATATEVILLNIGLSVVVRKESWNGIRSIFPVNYLSSIFRRDGFESAYTVKYSPSMDAFVHVSPSTGCISYKSPLSSWTSRFVGYTTFGADCDTGAVYISCSDPENVKYVVGMRIPTVVFSRTSASRVGDVYVIDGDPSSIEAYHSVSEPQFPVIVDSFTATFTATDGENNSLVPFSGSIPETAEPEFHYVGGGDSVTEPIVEVDSYHFERNGYEGTRLSVDPTLSVDPKTGSVRRAPVFSWKYATDELSSVSAVAYGSEVVRMARGDKGYIVLDPIQAPSRVSSVAVHGDRLAFTCSGTVFMYNFMDAVKISECSVCDDIAVSFMDTSFLWASSPSRGVVYKMPLTDVCRYDRIQTADAVVALTAGPFGGMVAIAENSISTVSTDGDSVVKMNMEGYRIVDGDSSGDLVSVCASSYDAVPTEEKDMGDYASRLASKRLDYLFVDDLHTGRRIYSREFAPDEQVMFCRFASPTTIFLVYREVRGILDKTIVVKYIDLMTEEEISSSIDSFSSHVSASYLSSNDAVAIVLRDGSVVYADSSGNIDIEKPYEKKQSSSSSSSSSSSRSSSSSGESSAAYPSTYVEPEMVSAASSHSVLYPVSVLLGHISTPSSGSAIAARYSSVQVLVGHSMGGSELWDSGVMCTDKTSVLYGGGNNLQPGQRYYVSVRVGDGTSWTPYATSMFVMGHFSGYDEDGSSSSSSAVCRDLKVGGEVSLPASVYPSCVHMSVTWPGTGEIYIRGRRFVICESDGFPVWDCGAERQHIFSHDGESVVRSVDGIFFSVSFSSGTMTISFSPAESSSSSSSSSGRGFPDVFDGGMTGLPIVQTYWKLDAMETGDPADVSFDGGLVS